MRVTAVRRYPVKSMLGERLTAAGVGPAGVEHDRGLALLDTGSGTVATAKHPRLWRALLRFSATRTDDRVRITGPDGTSWDSDDPAVDAALSEALGRHVRLSAERPDGATVERPDPEDVLEHGADADVPAPPLEIGQGTPGRTFVDYAPVHLITTATLEGIGSDPVRYRPNLVVDAGPGAFPENDWVDREIHLGDPGADGVVLRVSLPTPRCAVPTLEHGSLPRDPHAVRTLLDRNRVDVPGFGVLPCAGVYARVERAGVVRVGDPVVLV